MKRDSMIWFLNIRERKEEWKKLRMRKLCNLMFSGETKSKNLTLKVKDFFHKCNQDIKTS